MEARQHFCLSLIPRLVQLGATEALPFERPNERGETLDFFADGDSAQAYPLMREGPFTRLSGTMTGKLYLVALPIGNLEDITIRAIRILRSVDGILAEDTRITKRILDRFRIETPFFSSVFQGGERQRTGWLVEQLRAGKDLALVSDAGTPLISDPGYPLVREAISAGISVIPIPGPSAAIAGLIASGMPPDRFCFEGAAPRKPGERRALFERLRSETRTIVLFESPRRLIATLRDLAAVLPYRPVTVARELTKYHEEFLRGSSEEVLDVLSSRERVKGECVLILAGNPTEVGPDPERIRGVLATLREEGVAGKGLVRVLVEGFGLARNAAYALVHDEDEMSRG
jgi:16S rRNA (cytidine1402-2'-O)-methyltransferase